jgi:hypothetical protein
MDGAGSPASTAASVVREMPTRRAISTVPSRCALRAAQPVAQLQQQLALQDGGGIWGIHMFIIIDNILLKCLIL